MKKIVLSGAGGFLGTNIIESCLKTGSYEIYALTSKIERLNDLYGQNQGFHAINRQDVGRVNNIYSGAIVISCAFPRNADGIKMAEGLLFVTNFLQEAVDGGAGAVISISSQSVYNQRRESPADEKTELDLASSYAVGKYAQELLTNSICRNIAHTNLRLSSLFGKGFEQRVTNKMVKQCLGGEEIRVAVGERRFAFMDVRDAAEAILRLAENTFSTWDEIYNIGSIRGYTLEEMAQEIVGIYKETTGKSIPIILQGETEWGNSEVNCKKFMKQFNWAPHYSFHDTIVDMFNYYSREGNNIYA